MAGPVEKLRALVHRALEDGVFFNACTFADKLVTLSCGEPEDVLLLARAHVAMGDHRQVRAPVYPGSSHAPHAPPTHN